MNANNSILLLSFLLVGCEIPQELHPEIWISKNPKILIYKSKDSFTVFQDSISGSCFKANPLDHSNGDHFYGLSFGENIVDIKDTIQIEECTDYLKIDKVFPNITFNKTSLTEWDSIAIRNKRRQIEKVYYQKTPR